jgi:hypothetical protein
MLQDSSFINSVLSSLPGVDPNDEKIQAALRSFQGESQQSSSSSSSSAKQDKSQEEQKKDKEADKDKKQ